MNAGMKIVHITDGYLPRLGGIELHVRDLAVHQRAAGARTDIVTRTGETADAAAEGFVHRLRGGASMPADTEAALIAGDYDVVHVHASVVSPLAVAGVRAAARLGLPALVTVHSMWNGLGPLPRWYVLARGLAGLPVRWSAVSSVVVAQVRNALGAHRQVDLAPNGIDTDYWRAAAGGARERDHLTIAAVMRFAGRKQPLLLLDVLRELRHRLPVGIPVRAVVVGDGAKLAQARRYVERHDMAGWVDLPGRRTRDQVREVLAESDVFVAPARQESFGLAALEARCAGLPVVAMADSGVTDFVLHRRNGLLAHDADDLLACLQQLCLDQHLREEIAEHNARQLPTYDWSRVVGRTGELYDRAAGERRIAASRWPVLAGSVA